MKTIKIRVHQVVNRKAMMMKIWKWMRRVKWKRKESLKWIPMLKMV